MTGQKIFARDTCLGLDGPPVIVSAGQIAPLMSPRMIGVLVAVLGLVGILGLRRLRSSS